LTNVYPNNKNNNNKKNNKVKSKPLELFELAGKKTLSKMLPNPAFKCPFRIASTLAPPSPS
jgi:hypothetical protein